MYNSVTQIKKNQFTGFRFWGEFIFAFHKIQEVSVLLEGSGETKQEVSLTGKLSFPISLAYFFFSNNSSIVCW